MQGTASYDKVTMERLGRRVADAAEKAKADGDMKTWNRLRLLSNVLLDEPANAPVRERLRGMVSGLRGRERDLVPPALLRLFGESASSGRIVFVENTMPIYKAKDTGARLPPGFEGFWFEDRNTSRLGALIEDLRFGLSEAKAVTGKAQRAVMQALQHGEMSLTDLSRDPGFRGVNLKQIMKSVEALARAGYVKYDTRTQTISLAESLDEAAGRTFIQARQEILDYLEARHWTLSSRSLKVPHATSPDGKVRLWFKAQAVYFTKTDGRMRHDFGEARSWGFSYDQDIRKITPEQFFRRIELTLLATP